jgi:putative aldouronate transport system substrate-binding protein
MHSGKKILSLALALATVLPLSLAGCQKQTETTSSAGGETSSAAAESSAAPKETVTLKIMTGDKTIQGLDRVQKAVNEYLKEQNTGLQISWETYSWDDLKTKSATMLSTGQELDIVNTANWIDPGYIAHCTKGEFTDITKYVEDPKYKDVIDIIGKDFLDGTKVNGKYYGMPTNKEKAHNWGFLVQTKEMEKLGIDPKSIKSLEDMEKYFDQAKKDGYIPLCCQGMDHPFKLLDWDTIDADSAPFAFDPNDEKTVVNQFTADKSIELYKKMKVYHDKGYFSKDVLTVKGQEQEMKTGKYFCGTWSLMPGKAVTESASLGLDLTQIDITPVEKTNRETTGAMLAIPASSKHPDEAFQFIAMLYTDEKLINMMTFGIEGQDYVVKSNENGKKIITQKKDSDFQSAGGWIMGNEFINYLMDTQSPTLYDDIKAYNDSAKVLDDLGFVYDNSKMKTQYSNCQGVVNKYYPQLFYGTAKDVDATVAKMKQEFKQCGIDELIADVQAQYDAWRKANGKS